LSNKKKYIFKEENINKKIKFEMDKWNKTNNNCTSNLTFPPKGCSILGIIITSLIKKIRKLYNYYFFHSLILFFSQ